MADGRCDAAARHSRLDARHDIRPDVPPGHTLGPAAEAGLREGDVIIGVAGRDVADVQAALGAIREAARTLGSAVAIRIFREGRGAFVVVEMPPAQG